MNKIILVLCAIVAVANGVPEDSEFNRLVKYIEENEYDNSRNYLKKYFDDMYDSSMKPFDEEKFPELQNLYKITVEMIKRRQNLTNHLTSELFILDNFYSDIYKIVKLLIPTLDKVESDLLNCTRLYAYALPEDARDYMYNMWNFTLQNDKCQKLKTPEKYLPCMYFPHKNFKINVEDFKNKSAARVEKILREYADLCNTTNAFECINNVDSTIRSTVYDYEQSIVKYY